MNYSEFEAHFPQLISKSLVKYVTDTVLEESRYLFIKSLKGIQAAYCTHCNRQHYPTAKLKHKQKETVKCPRCKSECSVRAAGISRKYMEDRAVLVWYEKSVINPQAITARIISVYRNYSGDFKNVETMYNCTYMYLFEPGRSTFYHHRREKAKKVYSAFDRYYSGYGTWPKFMSLANIRKAVKGTAFQYSTWESYTKYQNRFYVSDMTEFFDLAARYPCVEYLTKLGFSKFIWAKLHKEPTYGAVNWMGNTITKVLRLSKAELKEVRKCNKETSPSHLRFYQVTRKRGLSLTWEEAGILSDVYSGMSETYYKIALTFAPEPVVIKYLIKQLNKGHYREVYTVLSDWRDYRGQCETLRMSLKEDRYLFPNDLHEAHMKLTKRIKLKEDKEINKKIQSRLEELCTLSFEWNGYMVRPAASSVELFEEGKALNHCVGGYADRYVKGECDLFLIRRVEQPDKPFFTMEVRKGKVVQCRGIKNCAMTPEIQSLVEMFTSTKLAHKKENNRVKVGIAV